MPPVHDTRYLQELVGDALARGCAATAAAQPNDPVQFLGQWLLRYVKNAQIEGEYASEKEAQIQARKAQLEAAAAEAAKVKAEQETRREAIIALSKMSGEPRELLQAAVELIVKFTQAKAAYAAFVAEPEEPDWTPPEDPDDPAAAESEDDPDPSPPAPPPEAGEEGAAPVEGGDAPQADSEEAAGDAKPDIQRMIDYSKKYLSYLAASRGQEFMLTTELYRPAPPPEDSDAKPEPTPFTFRILDERRPMVYAANAAFEPSMRFFRKFPKIGAYQACGVQSPSTGEFKAVVAADTLFPESGGQALSQDDQDFIWHVSRALSQALDAVEQQAAAALEGRSAKELVEGLAHSITLIYHPPEAQAAQAAGGDAAAAPPAEDAAAPADAPAEGGEAGDDPVSLIKGEVASLEAQLTEASAAREAASGALDKAQAALRAIRDVLQTVGPTCLPVLRHMRVVPQATFHVLKAVLHVLGKEPTSFLNWKRAHAYFELALLEQLQSYDATQVRDAEVWKRARCCYKALGEEGRAKLEAEMPDSQLGVLLLMWLKQVRKVARKAAALAACVAADEGLQQQLVAKKVELTKAEEQKAADEEAARKAAEEAAAAEAAAAAAEAAGAEGEGEAEEES